ncbi:hypothetical protein ANN_25145 [Periplaneta americana]|uniref:Uncharacterized protein n=1 Tax=Periplaneta americana TaxID=6978 RepID=A0ABQ8S0J4_PERAM|nr:hypothetical protein ANN_25145 [Periplaneta americana]
MQMEWSLIPVNERVGLGKTGSKTNAQLSLRATMCSENPGKNLNQVTCPDQDSNPGHLVSWPDSLTVTPQIDAPIPAPTVCEVRSVIKCLNAQDIVPIEIYRQLCQVYGPNVMSKQMVHCSTRSSVMMVGIPLCSSSCTFWRSAENCLHQQRTIYLLMMFGS